MSDDLIILLALSLLILVLVFLQRRRRKTAWESLRERVRILELEIDRLKTFSSRLEALEQRILVNAPIGPEPAGSSPKPVTVTASEVQGHPVSSTAFEQPSHKDKAVPHKEAVTTAAHGTNAYRNWVLLPPSAPIIRSDTSKSAQTREAAAAPGLADLKPRHGIKEWFKKAVNYEEMVGGNLFTKVGVVFVVLGLSLFVATQWHRFGPGLRVLIGYLVSGLMLAPGMIFERREKWRILARAGIGGGWALLYFVTYAMHHVVSPPLLASEAIDLVLMLAVAAGIVSHTLKYRSQVVTGLALLLAFTTVTISHVSVYSLAAGGLLALALVIIVWRLGWYELEVFGIVAAFLNHYLWLRPIIARAGAHHAFPGYHASCALLIFYWAVFTVSYVIRRIRQKREETVSAAALLLNLGLFLGIMGYQAVYPPHNFLLFLTTGVVELALGQLKVIRRRRTAFVLLTTAGAILLIAAFPYKFSGSQLSVLWLAEAEAFILAGIVARESLFRWLGLIALGLTAGQMLTVDAGGVASARWRSGAFHAEPRLAVLFCFATVLLYTNAHWLTRR